MQPITLTFASNLRKHITADAFPQEYNEACLNLRENDIEDATYSLQTSEIEACLRLSCALIPTLESDGEIVKDAEWSTPSMQSWVKWALTVKAAGWGSSSLDDNFTVLFDPNYCDIESVRATLEGVLEECRNLLDFDGKETLAIEMFLCIDGLVPPLKYTYSASNRVLCLSVM